MGARGRAAALALALIGVAVVGVWIWRGREGVEGPAKEPRLAPEATRLSPGVSLLGGLEPSAAYAVETGEGIVLVDSGLAADAGKLKEQMRKLGLDPGRVRAILLTHAHGDHCGGAARIREETGAKVYAGRADAGIIRAGGPWEAVFSTFHMPDDRPHPTPVDVELDGGEAIRMGEATFRAVATPGHTPGSVCYELERGGKRLLFTGDVVMMVKGDPKLADDAASPLGIYSAYLAPRYRGDARAYLESLRALKARPAPDVLLPGHPRSDPEPESPALEPGAWAAMMDRGIGEMETLVGRYERDGADFLDGNAKELLPGLLYLGEFQGGAVYGFFVEAGFFLVDAPGGEGLGAFVEAGLKRLGRTPVAPRGVLLTSCGEEATGGLADLLARGKPAVLAGTSGLERVEVVCPSGTEIVPAEGLAAKGWFPLKVLAMRGRGLAPTAYRVEIGGKAVVFSGRMPVKVNHGSTEGLVADLAGGRGDAREYLASLSRLRGWSPDLWLPAAPVDGQNANLYGGQWGRVLDENAVVVKAKRD